MAPSAAASSNPLQLADPLSAVTCLEPGFEAGSLSTPPSPAATLAELRRIAEAHRSLGPLFRGLRVATTPTDAELARWTLTVEEVAARVLAETEALLRLLDRVELPAALQDLGGLVGAEIGSQRQLLRQALSRTAVPVWEKGSLAQGLSSKVLKAAIAVENAYCEVLGCERSLTLRSEIEEALAVRQAYCKLWCSLPPSAAADPKQVEAGLRRGATAIAMLLGREIFLDLRFDDRRLILSMQRRIRGWLAGGGDSEAGQPLLQDLTNLFVLLSQINNRIELLMHDELQVKRLLARLRDASPTRPLQDAEWRNALWPLLGRDPRLDQLLLEDCRETPGTELERILKVIAQRWNKPPRESPAPFPDAGQNDFGQPSDT